MRHLRTVLVAVLFLNAALLAVHREIAAVRLRYEAAEKQERLRSLALENRMLKCRLAEARRPQSIARRAAALGLDVREARQSDIERPGHGGPSAGGGGVGRRRPPAERTVARARRP